MSLAGALHERLNHSGYTIAPTQLYTQQTEIQKNAGRLIYRAAKRGDLLISIFVFLCFCEASFCLVYAVVS